MTLNGVMAVILRYFSEFGYLPGAVAYLSPGRSRKGDANQPDQKYFMTNDQKSEFDIVF